MKFKISLIAILSVLVLSFFGCEDDNLNEDSYGKSNNNNISLIDRVQDRFNVDYINTISESKYEVKYKDGSNLIVDKIGNSEMFVTGNKIDNKKNITDLGQMKMVM